MERMDLIAINNRSMCNHSKIQRAERITKRPHGGSNKLPNLKEIRLDTRRHSIIRTLKSHSSNPNPTMNKKFTENSLPPDEIET